MCKLCKYLAEKKTIYHEELIPAAVAIHCNVPGHDQAPTVIIESDPHVLAQRMFQTLESVSLTAFENFKQDSLFGPLIGAMECQVSQFKQCVQKMRKVRRMWRAEGRMKEPAVIAELESLEFELRREKDKAKVADDFLRWCRQLPTIGFNSSKFKYSFASQPYREIKYF